MLKVSSRSPRIAAVLLGTTLVTASILAGGPLGRRACRPRLGRAQANGGEAGPLAP